MAVTWITPTEITPDTADQWVDKDLSGLVPAGKTGVILHIVNTTYSSYLFGFRKNGSTDNRTQQIQYGHWHIWCAIGIDANRILELFVDSTTGLDIYLVGYFGDDAVFKTNGVDKSPGAAENWLDVDISGDTGGDTAIASIIEVIGVAAIGWGIRKNGSSDDRHDQIYAHSAGVIGVDGSEIFEGWIGDTDVDFFLVGYIKSDGTFNTNATDLSLDTVDTWLDLSALPLGATGGFIQVHSPSTYTDYCGLRKNGSSEDIYQGAGYRHCYGLVECDGSRIIEGKIKTTYVDFFLAGYPTSGAPPAGLKKMVQIM